MGINPLVKQIKNHLFTKNIDKKIPLREARKTLFSWIYFYVFQKAIDLIDNHRYLDGVNVNV